MRIRVGPPYFRSGTSVPRVEPNLFLVDAGLGDQCAMLTALTYLATTQPHVRATLWYQPFMRGIVANVFSQITRDHGWDFRCTENLEEKYLVNRPLLKCEPNSFVNGGGAHMLDLGFLYFVGLNSAPQGWENYMELDLVDTDIKKFNLPREYFCMTPGAMWKTKSMPPALFNKIQDYVIGEYDLVPVYLGKRDFTGEGKTMLDGEYDFSKGIDLLDKTNLVECAKVIDNSEFILGIDNGLLHLAAMTTAPIVDGYTISAPKYVRPKRRSGEIYDVEINDATLTCIHCQQKQKYLNHHVRECFYKDLNCLSLLEYSPLWKTHVDRILG